MGIGAGVAVVGQVTVGNQLALVQIDAINRLKKCGMLNDLPSELREIAELRTENPDFSLKQIGDSMSVPMTRSGANHRLKKLCALAEKCK